MERESRTQQTQLKLELRQIEVEIQALRREQQFRSALELTNQIRHDIERSRRYFARHPIRLDDGAAG